MSEIDYPKLEFVNGKADASKWFGGEACYYASKNNKEFRHDGIIMYPHPMCEDDARFSAEEARAWAQKHFNAHLKEPMDFGAAMAAVARGVDVYREKWGSNHHLIINPASPHISRYYVPETLVAPWTPTVDGIQATDWHFHFPRKEPEKVYAKVGGGHVREEWTCSCGNRHGLCFRAYEGVPSVVDCPACGVTMHRPLEGE